ncbi:MAG: PKD domain-containing protein [Candidatus Omnitrophota bacterium]
MVRKVILILAMLCVSGISGFALDIPKEDARIKYFYVFGPQGNTDYGAESNSEIKFYIDVPETESGDLSIYIYDPDTSAKVDYYGGEYSWDTVTDFSVYGAGDNLLTQKTFGVDDYDGKYFLLGQYAKEKGTKLGGFYRFVLDVKATQGHNANLFNLRISPDSAEVFSNNITFRLLAHEGDKMYLYPEIPAGIRNLIVENYDMDVNGGSSELVDPQTGISYPISDSKTGQWAKTIVPLSSNQPRRLQYVITKKLQKEANAGVRFSDDNDNALPIYFKSGKAQVMPLAAPAPIKLVETKNAMVVCNKFVFDATDSHAADNSKISYLWDFGDGTTSVEPVVEHFYEKPGNYNVILKVQDESGLACNNSISEKAVRVNGAPVAAFSAGSELVCINQDIVFDASASTDDVLEKLTYAWDFGDGTRSTEKQATKSYKDAGDYRVVLTVNDNEGTPCSVSFAQKIINVKAQPVIGKLKDINICFAPGEAYKVLLDYDESKFACNKDYTYTWDFGDGETATGSAVPHTYKKGGKYQAKLTVNDGLGLACSSATENFMVNLNRPPVARAKCNALACVGEEVNFDGSNSLVEEGDNLTYSWDFGDGTSAQKGVKVAHTYNKGGNYKAVLTVDNGMGGNCSSTTDTLSVVVNSGPKAKLGALNTVCLGKEIQVDASGSADPDNDNLTYVWDFGDGTVKAGAAKETHLYQKGGMYTIKVTVDDGKGTPCSQNSASEQAKINTPPVADTGKNMICCVEVNSIFDASASSDADGDTLTYAWDLGDGSKAKGAKVTHRYTKAGIYTITLTVDDNSGTVCSSATSSFTATVHEKPVSIIKVR